MVELRERVDDRREEEPRQQQRADEMLDVAVQHVQARKREREARRNAHEQGRERQCEQFRAARFRNERERQDEQDREHQPIRDEVRADDGESGQLPREARPANQRRVVEHRTRPGLDRRREEDPRREPGEQVQRVVRDRRRAPQVVEHEQVHAHQHERRDQHPDDAEHRSLVLGVQVAAEEVPEQLAIADQIGVDRHLRRLVYGGLGHAPVPKHGHNSTWLAFQP